MKKLLVILGPTATGKTDLALQLARKFQGELVSADSRQVYKGLDIGTGKLPSSGRWKIEAGRWIVNGIPIHMYDVVSYRKQYTVADYVKDARKVIRDIRGKGKLSIIVGGTGLYLNALLYGLANLSIPVEKKLRKELEELSIIHLQERLKKTSPIKWKSMNNSDKRNSRRLIRAIELEIGKRNEGNKSNRNSQGLAKDFEVLKIGLTASREILYKRVDNGVVNRINKGMVEEVKKLHNMGLTLKRMKQLGLEYGVLADYLAGKIKYIDELIKIMQGKIHGYVRRQLTWFKKEEDVVWFDITDKNFSSKVENDISKWYYPSDDTKN